MAVRCKICKVRPAKIHYTEIVNNQMVTLDLCLECAEEKGIDVQKNPVHGLGDLVAELIDSTVDGGTERIGRLSCPSCGYDYSDFKKIGRFGCPDCYVAFQAQLPPLLRHIHGSTHHAGKAPTVEGTQRGARERVAQLRDDLAGAIQREDYEKAAVIRDEIRRIQSEKGGEG